jgi:hypothetical protein
MTRPLPGAKPSMAGLQLFKKASSQFGPSCNGKTPLQQAQIVLAASRDRAQNRGLASPLLPWKCHTFLELFQ